MELVSRILDGSILYSSRGEPLGPSFYRGRVTQDDRIERLEEVNLLAGCSRKQLRAIARISEVLEVPAGSVLARRGDPGDEFFLILDGSANVLRNGRKIATLGRGQYFGELSLLDRGPRSATVKAATDLDVLVLGQREFGGVLDSVPALSRKLLAAMASRLRAADTKALAH